jgi:hypothetical protein
MTDTYHSDDPFAEFRIKPTAPAVPSPTTPGASPAGTDAFAEFRPPSASAATASAPISQARAAVLGGLSGASANFADEVYGLSEASGLPRWLGGFRAPVGGARMLYEKFTAPEGAEKSDFTKRYEEATAERRAEMKAAETQHPGTFLGAQVTGSLMAPGSTLVRGATLPIRTARSAAFGAGYGGAAGAGAGETPEERISGATSGAMMGGIFGAAAPPVVEGVIAAGRPIVAPIASAVRGAVNPEREAARIAGAAVAEGVRADPAAAGRLTVPEFAGNVAQGGPATLMDLGGERARAVARAAANTSPEARQTLNAMIDPRFETQSERVAGHLRGIAGESNTAIREQVLEQAARGANRTAYGRAYEAGAGSVGSPELERLASSDAVATAMRAAAAKARDEAVISGHGAMNPRVAFTKDGQVQFQRSPSGMPVFPDLQFWDLTRRELSDAARRAGPGTSEARRLNNFATALNAELDQVVPEYAAARRGAAGFFGAENALEAGEKFVGAGKRLGVDRARIALAQMSPQEQAMFRDAYLGREANRIAAIPDRADVVRRIRASPASREELSLILSPQQDAELAQLLRVEGVMDRGRQATQGNSTTARQLVELGLLGSAGTGFGYGGYNQDPMTMGLSAGAAALTAGGRRINQRVMSNVADILASQDPGRLMRGAGARTPSMQGVTNQALAAVQERAQAEAMRAEVARILAGRGIVSGGISATAPRR